MSSVPKTHNGPFVRVDLKPRIGSQIITDPLSSGRMMHRTQIAGEESIA